MFRCDELMETAYRSFNTAVEPVRQQLSNPEGSFVPAFGELVRQAEEEALSTYTQQTNKPAVQHRLFRLPSLYNRAGQYEAPASRYHTEVAARKGAALKEKMLDASYALFLQQMRRIYEAAIQHADTLAKKLSPSTSDAKEGKSPQVALMWPGWWRSSFSSEC